MEYALIRQKDHILTLVRDEKYEEAIMLLNFSEDLWRTVNYAYKTREIRQIIKSELLTKQGCCAHWKQHEMWGKLMAKC